MLTMLALAASSPAFAALAAFPLVAILSSDLFWRFAFLGVSAVLAYVGKTWKDQARYERIVKVGRDILTRVVAASAGKGYTWQQIADIALEELLKHASADPSIGTLSETDIAGAQTVITLSAKQALGHTNGALKVLPGGAP